MSSLIRTTSALLFASIATVASVGSAAADGEIARPNSVNVSPLGIIGGGYYSANYERLLPGGHGVLGEFGYGSASDGNSKASNFAGTVGYRWHWRGRQNSGFLGLSVGYVRGSGTWTDDNSDIDLTVSQFGVTANIGKRWAWDSGLNITIRLGGGYGKWMVDTSSMDPDAQRATDQVEDVLAFIPIAIDSELSVGYTF